MGMGNIYQKSGSFAFDEEKIHVNKSLLKMPEKCRDCFCKWHCAGDCPDTRNINYDRCYVNKRLIQYELESILTGMRKFKVHHTT